MCVIVHRYVGFISDYYSFIVCITMANKWHNRWDKDCVCSRSMGSIKQMSAYGPRFISVGEQTARAELSDRKRIDCEGSPHCGCANFQRNLFATRMTLVCPPPIGSNTLALYLSLLYKYISNCDNHTHWNVIFHFNRIAKRPSLL